MVGSQLMEIMMERELRQLVKDCQTDLAKYLVPDSGITEKEIISKLLQRLDGPQAREAMRNPWLMVR